MVAPSLLPQPLQQTKHHSSAQVEMENREVARGPLRETKSEKAAGVGLSCMLPLTRAIDWVGGSVDWIRSLQKK